MKRISLVIIMVFLYSLIIMGQEEVPKLLPKVDANHVSQVKQKSSRSEPQLDYNPLVDDIIKKTNLDSLVKYVRILSGEDSVWVNDSKVLIKHRISNLGNDLAADYIKNKLEEYELEVYDQVYDEKGRNILGIQQGYLYPEEQYIICAHYDGVPNYGADDNASGVAAVLEAARILSEYETAYTLVYALWDEEEIGLRGSRYYASEAKTNEVNIKGVLNLDMIAWDSNSDGLMDIHSSDVASSTGLANLLVDINSTYVLDLSPVIYDPGTGQSDHSSFWNEGFGAVLIIEAYYGDDLNDYYHSDKDRITEFNLPYFHEMGKLATGAISTLVEVSTNKVINGWEFMESMDIARGGSGSCVHDSLIYVFGGCNSAVDILSSAQAYNVNTNEWSDLAPMPLGLYEPNVEIINDTVYIAGGWYKLANGNWTTTESTFAYDPGGDNWTVRANCPKATGTNSSCVLNDTLFILGGTEFPGSTDVKKAWYYSPEKDIWGEIQDMIYEHGEYGSACVIDSTIYAIGGVNATTAIMYPVQAEKYSGETWEKIADMPVPIANHVTVIHENNILVFGGDSGKFTPSKSYATNFVQEYDPTTDSWSRMQGMPFNRSNMTGDIVGDFVYLIGGYTHSRDFKSPLDEVWRYDLNSLIIEHVEIPDTAFLYALIDVGVDTNGDSLITYEEAEVVKALIIPKNVYNFRGLEAFVNLDSLSCSSFPNSSFELGNLVGLKYLDINYHHVTMGDLPEPYLDLSDNIELETLELLLRYINLKNLDLSKNTLLSRLTISQGGQLTRLDLSNNQELTQLDLFNCYKLSEVCVWEMPFPPDGIILDTIDCPKLLFTTECRSGIVNIPDSAFLLALTYRGVDSNGDGLISYEEAEEIQSLDISDMGITDMSGIEAFINLEELYCGFNGGVDSLDLSNNPRVKALFCQNNNLLHLDVSACSVLEVFWCEFNQLTVLDLTNCPELVFLAAQTNQLSSIDLTNNTLLEHLDLAENQLSYLNLTNILSLESCDFGDNPLISLDLRNNQLLYTLILDYLPSLYQVCVWDSFTADSKDMNIETTGSPNIFFTTECTIGIEETINSGLSVYPNPGSSHLTIETTNPDHYSIEITSLNGQHIYQDELEGSSFQIDLSGFQKGVYFITIRSINFVTTRKFIRL